MRITSPSSSSKVVEQQSKATNPLKTVMLLDLPNELLYRIFDYLTFDETCGRRAVSRKFDKIAKNRLNAGFRRLEQVQCFVIKSIVCSQMHQRAMAAVKNSLPRRESERRNHPLSRHSDILTAIETRLSLLGMTYNKFIDLELCCFIPGKVLDETFAILRTITRSLADNSQPSRPHELLQELRDISSMAMEHFDERIAPLLRDKAMAGQTPVKSARDSLSMVMIGAALRCTPPSTSVLNDGVASSVSAIRQQLSSLCQPTKATTSTTSVVDDNERLRARVHVQSSMIATSNKEIALLKARVICCERRANGHEKKIADQGRIIDEQKRKLDEFVRKFGELSRKMLQYDSTLTDLSTEVRASSSSTATTASALGASQESTVAVDSIIRKSRKRVASPTPVADVKRKRGRPRKLNQ